MKKKQKFELDLKWIAGIIAALGIISGGIVGAAKWLTLPDAVAGQQKQIDSLKEIAVKQQATLDVTNQILQNVVSNSKEKEEIIYSQDKRFFWDKALKEWRPIKELNPLKELEHR